VWTANLLRGRIGLVAWSVSVAFWSAIWGSLLPTVMDAFSAFEDYAAMAGGGPGVAPETQYLSLIGDLVSPVVAAYVVTQAAGWVADLEQGRVEAVLATPVSWTRLVAERALSTMVGVLLLTVAAFTGLAAGVAGAGASLDPAGLARVALGCLLLGAATAGVCAAAVAVLRSGLAVVLVAAYLGASYLLGLLVSLLDWPAWVARLSVFGAFGHPYIEWPPPGGTLLLVALALGGISAAAMVSERSPKVA
jgi:ABC-2 type transport system permease protein